MGLQERDDFTEQGGLRLPRRTHHGNEWVTRRTKKLLFWTTEGLRSKKRGVTTGGLLLELLELLDELVWVFWCGVVREEAGWRAGVDWWSGAPITCRLEIVGGWVAVLEMRF